MMNNLPKLPTLPRAKKAGKPRPCSCGCGAETRGGRWIPGHDAILLAWVLRLERGQIAAIPAPHTEQADLLIAERRANGTTGMTHGAGKQLVNAARPMSNKERKAARREAKRAAAEAAAANTEAA